MLTLLYLSTLVISLGTLYGVVTIFYNLFLHPLRKYPGPLLNRITRMKLACYKLSGTDCHHVRELHEKYGRVVRVSPSELSFVDEQALVDIYGIPTPLGSGNLPKDHRLQRRDVNGSINIITANDADHRRLRRIQTNMFSEKVLVAQEPVIKNYVNTLIACLHEKASNSSSNVVDIVKWYNYTTFDILGDLAFGASFGGLKSDHMHVWIKHSFLLLRDINYYSASRNFPWPLNNLIYKFSPSKTRIAWAGQNDFAIQKTRERMSKNSTDRADFMSYILKHNDEKGMTRPEIENNARVLILAGSETTSTFLSGFTYNLLRNPQHLSKLTALIRSTFDSEEDIKVQALNNLEYLNNLINESFRIYPPVPNGLPRMTTRGGNIICGEVVPEMTRVSLASLAANTNERNWADPHMFVPERWYKGEKCPEKYRADKRKVMQPFSYGPRNCIGKNLAMLEIRLITAHLLWNFDLELQPDNLNWSHQKAYLIWERKPLHVKLIPRSK